MKKALLVVIALLPLVGLSQVKITGRVINQRDTHPVPNASVFLSNATIGDHTKDNGIFTLNNVKPGKYELVISLLGFDKYTQTLTVDNSDIKLPDITLFPKTIGLSEVKIITPKTDLERQRNYDWFKEEFLGKGELAKECKVINPEILDMKYDERNGILTASSVDFLIIENRALGYRIRYLLSNFTLNNYDEQNKTFSYAGSVFFELLKGNAADEQQWKERRQEVYEGSLMHFLRSALNDKLEQEGFRILRVANTMNTNRPPDSVINQQISKFTQLKNEAGKKNYKDSLAYWIKKAKLPAIQHAKLLTSPLTRREFLRRTNQPGLYALMTDGKDALFITYDKYHHYRTGAYSHLSDADNTTSTLVSFNEPAAFFDNNGVLINPAGLGYEGVWSRNRLAALLPVDYEPEGDNTIAVDSTLVKSINSKFESYTTKHITEKAWLHFDKPYYAAGDTIYFKAYVTAGENHELSRLSGVLYADLINEQNKVSNSIRMLITDGVTWGDFALPQNLAGGNYRVRAYTQWMRNAGEAAFFEKTIAIGSAITPGIPESGANQSKTETAKPSFGFFPEGGSLTTGVRSKIAFKAIGPSGLSVDVKGSIVDQDGKEIDTFRATHLGMGYFYLTPSEAQTYTAIVSYPDGTHDSIALPKAKINNLGIAITDQNRFYNVKISASKQWFGENKNKEYTLIVYSGGNPHTYTVRLDNPEIDFTIAKNGLKTGITIATLFSAAGEPLCERLLFVQNNDGLKFNIRADKNTYNPRTKINILLNLTKDDSSPAQGYFSVSVTDESTVRVDENSEATIVNNLLLTSDLKGCIEQPNYYFTNINEKTRADLDLVMLTHGYRRFEWQKILDDKQLISYKPEKGLSINGQVKFNNKPVKNGKVRLFSKGAGGMILDTLTDAGGKFVFDNLSFNDTTKFVLQARTMKGEKEVEVKPVTIISEPEITTRYIPQLQADQALAVYKQISKRFLDEQDKYNINKHAQMLKEVVIRDKKVNPFEHSDNLNGKGNADQVLTSADLEHSTYSNLYDAVRAKANSISFTPDHKLLSKQTVVAGFNRLDVSPPDYMVIIVDGIILSNRESTNLIGRGILDDYNTSDIESVEILLGAGSSAIYGSIASGGAIIVTTKRAKKINSYYKEAPGVITFTANGFYKAREFYSPQYDNPHTNQKMADLRSTIYWNPNIITDNDGKASFEYFNADGKGTYRVVVEGIDVDGNLGRQVFRYKVE